MYWHLQYVHVSIGFKINLFSFLEVFTNQHYMYAPCVHHNYINRIGHYIISCTSPLLSTLNVCSLDVGPTSPICVDLKCVSWLCSYPSLVPSCTPSKLGRASGNSGQYFEAG